MMPNPLTTKMRLRKFVSKNDLEKWWGEKTDCIEKISFTGAWFVLCSKTFQICLSMLLRHIYKTKTSRVLGSRTLNAISAIPQKLQESFVNAAKEEFSEKWSNKSVSPQLEADIQDNMGLQDPLQTLWAACVLNINNDGEWLIDSDLRIQR